MTTRPVASSTLLVVVASAAITLLSLSWPRLQASFTYLPVDTAIKNYYASREIPSRQLPGLIKRAQQAIARHDHYRYREGLSTLYYLRGLDVRSPSLERRPAFERAIVEAENVVSVAPARPIAWQRIARIHAILGNSAEKIIPPLKMSIYAGRVEPTLFIGRLELGYSYLASMDIEATALLRDQTLLTWKLQPGELTMAINNQWVDWHGVQKLLGGHNELVLQEVEASLGQAVR